MKKSKQDVDEIETSTISPLFWSSVNMELRMWIKMDESLKHGGMLRSIIPCCIKINKGDVDVSHSAGLL